MKLLIAEDQQKLAEAILETLTEEKFLCEVVYNYHSAHEKIHLYTYDLIIVDINLPDGSGLDLIREMKSINSQTGIIVISARNSLDNKVEGLDLGADDYLTKPFDLAELVARIKSLIRRRNFQGNSDIISGNLQVDTLTRTVKVEGKTVDLTKCEYDILLFFLSNQNRVLTKESIAEHIWGDNMDLADSFDFIYSHIKNLRKKISGDKAHDPIKGIYGIGYKFTG